MTVWTKCIIYRQVTGQALTPEQLRLVEAAREAVKTSYAPHSGFSVGAAAVLQNGMVVTASNQESDVFPSGMCAERIMLYRIQSGFPGQRIKSVAITARKDGVPVETEVYPCGACAQVFLDTERRQNHRIKFILPAKDHYTIIPGATGFLPFGFEIK